MVQRNVLLLMVVCLAGSALPVRATTIISEFMASNATTIADQDGDYADWLELYNPDSTPANLKGWYLTNKATKLTKWKIPAVTLQPGAYLVIFCSEKNYTDPTKPLATSFNISSSAGYLALVEADGATVASFYNYPNQYTDISYGVSQPTAAGEAVLTGLFKASTPGASNGDHTNILLNDITTLSATGGLFTGTTSVTISGAAAGEHIRYVLAPSSGNGDNVPAPTVTSTEYTTPLTISSTTLLKAAVFSSDDSQRGLPATALYVQLDNSTTNRVDTFTSILPLVVFDDHGFGLLPDDDMDHLGWIGVFSTAAGKATLTQTPDFFIPDTMKDHGFTSANFPKQSYDIDLTDTLGDDADESVLGMDVGKDWDSIAAWDYDRTYIHNAFIYSLSSSMGHWAPQTKFAEMFIHSAGGILDYTSYSGVVSMTDRIKIGPDRVNIYDIDTDDITAPNVTGGYILKIDHPDDDSYTWTTTAGNTVLIDSPKLDVLAPQQSAYITGYVQQMENAMYADQSSGWTTHTYTSYLDLPSWIDYHILTVLSENVDGLSFSEYFTKDVNGLIVAGPMWDYDRSMGSADGRDAYPSAWSPGGDDLWANGWWGVIGHDPDFMQAWVDRWQQLRGGLLSNGNIANLVNSLAAQIGPAAAARDSARWPDDASRYGGAYSGEITNLNSWLSTHVQFIDSQFAPTPSVSASGTSRTLTAPAGAKIAYTLDGSDPRLSGGGLSSTALLVAGPVTLSSTQAYSARSYIASMVGQYPGSPWSSPIGGSGRLLNVSSRAVTIAGNAALIDGFVVSGPVNSQEQVLLRAAGPSLAQFNTGSALLAQPTMSVFDSSGNLVATNTGWGTASNPAAIANAAAVAGAFAFTAGSADSALLLNLVPGAYTVQVSGVGQSTGLALAEVYEVGSSGSRVINFSSRGMVSVGGPMITGVVVSGTAPQQVLLRADGPALSAFGVSGALAQPVLQLFDSTGKVVASNTGWSTNSNSAQIVTVSAAVGAFALTAGSADSALLITLQPGSYTMQVSGVGGTSGVTLAEEYSYP